MNSTVSYGRKVSISGGASPRFMASHELTGQERSQQGKNSRSILIYYCSIITFSARAVEGISARGGYRNSLNE